MPISLPLLPLPPAAQSVKFAPRLLAIVLVSHSGHLAHFNHSGGFGEVSVEDRSVDSGSVSDPLFAVWARKAFSDTE